MLSLEDSHCASNTHPRCISQSLLLLADSDFLAVAKTKQLPRPKQQLLGSTTACLIRDSKYMSHKGSIQDQDIVLRSDQGSNRMSP